MKPKEITKKILKILLTASALTLAFSSPYFFVNLLNNKKYKYPKKKVARTFHYLKQKGLIKYKRKGRQIYISLTPLGRKYAQELQIDDLKIETQRRWDGKWRILIFDINEKWKIVREALRGKLKELGFFQLQKSVWICPFPCENEFKILKTFFNLPNKSFMFIVATKIPFEEELKKIYNL
ncbi:MAG: hypothetical protein AB1465_04905 [Patescibacteria group bacterium]